MCGYDVNHRRCQARSQEAKRKGQKVDVGTGMSKSKVRVGLELYLDTQTVALIARKGK